MWVCFQILSKSTGRFTTCIIGPTLDSRSIERNSSQKQRRAEVLGKPEN